MSDNYFDSTPSETQTPEETLGLNPPDDIQMRRTNPKRYDKRHDIYDNVNDAGHDSGIENRFEDPVRLLSWDIPLNTVKDIDEFVRIAEPGQIWISEEDVGSKRSRIYTFDKLKKRGRDWVEGAVWEYTTEKAIDKYIGATNFSPIKGASGISNSGFPLVLIGNFDVPSFKLTWDIPPTFEVGDRVKVLSKSIWQDAKGKYKGIGIIGTIKNKKIPRPWETYHWENPPNDDSDTFAVIFEGVSVYYYLSKDLQFVGNKLTWDIPTIEIGDKVKVMSRSITCSKRYKDYGIGNIGRVSSFEYVTSDNYTRYYGDWEIPPVIGTRLVLIEYNNGRTMLYDEKDLELIQEESKLTWDIDPPSPTPDDPESYIGWLCKRIKGYIGVVTLCSKKEPSDYDNDYKMWADWVFDEEEAILHFEQIRRNPSLNKPVPAGLLTWSALIESEVQPIRYIGIVDEEEKTSSDNEMEIDGETYVLLPDPSGASGSIGAALELKKRNGRMWCPKRRKKEFDELMESIKDDLKREAMIENLDWQIDSLVKCGRDDNAQLNNWILKRSALISWDIPKNAIGTVVNNPTEFLAIAEPGQTWKSLVHSDFDYLHLWNDFKNEPIFALGSGITINAGMWTYSKIFPKDYIAGNCVIFEDRFPLELISTRESILSWDIPEPQELEVGDVVKIVSDHGFVATSNCMGRVGRITMITSPGSHTYEWILSIILPNLPGSDMDQLRYIFKDTDIYVVEDIGFFKKEDLELVEYKKSFDLKENRVNYEVIPQEIRFKFREQHQKLFNSHPEILNGMNNVEFVFTSRPYGWDPNIPGFVHTDKLEVDLYGTPELLKKNPDAVVAMLNVVLQHVMRQQGFEKVASNIDPEAEEMFNKSEQDYIKQHENRLERLGPKVNVVWSGPEVQTFRFTQMLRLGDFNDKKIVDVGCGFGNLLDFLKEHGQIPERYVGIDLSEKMLNEARKQHPDEFFELRNIRTDPFDSNVFDYGIACGIFANHHEHWDAHVTAVLKSLLNSCKLGIGVNFLHENMKYIGGGLHYDNPKRVVDMLKSSLDGKIELLDHPEENDFTLLIRK